MAPEQVFMEMERIRLRHRMVRINKRLLHAYRRLGEQGLNDHAEGSIAGVVEPLVTEEEIARMYQEIENILKDQKKVLTEIEQLVSVMMPAEEIKHAE